MKKNTPDKEKNRRLLVAICAVVLSTVSLLSITEAFSLPLPPILSSFVGAVIGCAIYQFTGKK